MAFSGRHGDFEIRRKSQSLKLAGGVLMDVACLVPGLDIGHTPGSYLRILGNGRNSSVGTVVDVTRARNRGTRIPCTLLVAGTAKMADCRINTCRTRSDIHRLWIEIEANKKWWINIRRGGEITQPGSLRYESPGLTSIRTFGNPKMGLIPMEIPEPRQVVATYS